MNTKEILKSLGYTDEWMALGIIDDDYLANQWDEYLNSDDKNEEHYRCGAVIDFFERKRDLTDSEIEAFLALEDDGPDGCDLRQNRAIEVLMRADLTASQFVMLGDHVLYQEDPVRKRYVRESVIRTVERSGLSRDQVERIKNSEDSVLHEILLDHEEVQVQDLEWLQKHGWNKRIRSRALIVAKKLIKLQEDAASNGL